MKATLREFFNTTAGQVTALALILVGVGLAYWSIKANLGASEAVDLSSHRMFICSQTLKPFEYEISMGASFPVKSPFSGELTGYPAERCYWTKEGTIKADPTYVLLNQWVHKPGPTFCPDCGRLVIPHNPVPKPGDIPPPTEAEWLARHSGQQDMR